MSFKQAASMLALAILAGCGGGDHSDGVVSLERPAGYTLSWSDDFTQTSLNSDFWTFDTGAPLLGGSVWGNNEKQYYRSQNASLVNGQLVIQPALISPGGDITQQEITAKGLLATSARVKTDTPAFYAALKNKPYGFYEIRAQIPCVAGAWPAIWMLGKEGNWPARGEVDIMEWFGALFAGTEQIQAAVHTAATFGKTALNNKKTIQGVCTDFHHYQLHWTPQVLVMGVDGTEIFRYVKPANANANNWPFDQPAHLLLNVAVGGDLGGAVDVSQLPNMTLRVDWVKVWQP